MQRVQILVMIAATTWDPTLIPCSESNRLPHTRTCPCLTTPIPASATVLSRTYSQCRVIPDAPGQSHPGDVLRAPSGRRSA